MTFLVNLRVALQFATRAEETFNFKARFVAFAIKTFVRTKTIKKLKIIICRCNHDENVVSTRVDYNV